MSLTRRNGVVRPAGVKNYTASESASSALDFSARPSTPERLQRYRMPSEPGRRVRPGGPMRDDAVDTDRFYGKVEDKGATAAAALDRSRSKLEAYAEEKAEEVYRTKRREKLGKGYAYQKLPPKVQQEAFAFGRPSGRDGVTTKELVCPTDMSNDEVAAEDVYKKSHGAYAPGEQRTRMIDWSQTRVDPATVRFGAVAKRPEKNGVGKCLDPGKDEEQQQQRVVNLRVEAHRQMTRDQTGRARPLGLAPYSRPPPEVFGKSSGTGDEWGAAECLRGAYTEEEQLPDPDLGRSVSRHAGGGSAVARTGAEADRVFGIPSLRTDVPPRTFSIAEPQNFGQDAPLKDLVNPSRFMTKGVDHSDFARARPAAELRSLLEAAGYGVSLTDDVFAALYSRAARHGGVTGAGSVSVQELKELLVEYLDAVEEDGEPPAWFEEELERVGASTEAAAEAEGKATE